MEFLVRIEIRLPDDFSDVRREELISAEAARGRELLRTEVVRRIWRLPGRWANISLYDVADATQLHEVLTSLPLWPWMTVTVEPLAMHPLEQDRSG